MLPLLAAIVALAFVNYVAGRLGLLLAIPPGFATAVFPPSGIALAAVLVYGPRLAPGVLLGSLAFNLDLALASASQPTLLEATPVALGLALGSTLQAILGAWLIRRVARGSVALIRERAILAFLLLGGPVSCALASSWGVTTLAISGRVEGGQLLSTWFTWWVGDTLGVMIFAPLVLALVAGPREVWRPRLWSVGIPLCVAFGLVVTAYVLISRHEQQSVVWTFRGRTETLDRALRRELDAQVEVLWSIRSFFAASQSVEEGEFRTFVRRSLVAFPSLLAMSWNPRIPGRDRAGFERAMQGELGRDFEIRSRGPDGEPQRAAVADEHVVVRYIEPHAGNADVIGFDVFASVERRSAFERARDTGEPAATARIDLLQTAEQEYGVLFVLPIYVTDATPPTIEQRRSSLRGFAVAVLRADRFLGSVMARANDGDIAVGLWDVSVASEPRFLAGYPGESRRRSDGMEVATTHDVGGRTWQARYAPIGAALGAARGWQAWAVLAGGLASAGLLGAFLLVVTGRASIEQERLREVADLNERLRLTNEELAGFAHAASHDLKAPLRGISHLTQFIVEDHGAALPADVGENLDLIRVRVGRMEALLQDLLQYSHAGWLQGDPELVDVSAIVEEILELMPEMANFEVDYAGLPTLHTFRVPLTQVLRNLIGNARKHHDRATGRIAVTSRDLGDRVEFAVTDDGPGIPPEHHETALEMFRRLRPQAGVEGSGMGLALVRKIVTNRGGTIAIESDGQRGTTVRFTWPKSQPATAPAAVAATCDGEIATVRPVGDA